VINSCILACEDTDGGLKLLMEELLSGVKLKPQLWLMLVGMELESSF